MNLAKKEIRERMKTLELALDAESASDQERRFYERVEAMPEFRSAGTVLAYMSIPGEMPTLSFIEKWSSCKRIALPVVCGDMLQIRLYDPAKMTIGYKGIPEPAPSAPVIMASEIDFALIPGIAFAPCGDGHFKRLGRGKGFYDRLLPELSCKKIPAAYDFRIIDDVPCDPWDAIL